MATRLDKTKEHQGFPMVGGKGDDEWSFDIPPDEELTDVGLDLLGGQYRDGVRLEYEPRAGATGPGHKVKVHWWFDGGIPPGFVKYRVRAFTRVVGIKNVLVCAIENTRHVPMPDLDGLPIELRRTIETITSEMAEVFEENNIRALLGSYYDSVVVLAENSCSKAGLRAALLAHSSDYRVDLTFVGHGADECIALYGGDYLTNSDIIDWKNSGDFTGRKLGLVYMMPCVGGSLNNDWRNLGFKTSIGPKGNNWMPEPMFSNFCGRWRNGEAAAEAALEAWKVARAFWQLIYLPTIHWERTGPLPWMGRLVSTDNEKITSSKPKILGDGELRIYTRI